MRGLELPINIIVIIAIAVLVLTVIAAFFTGALGGGTNAIATEQAFQKGCQLLRTVQACDSGRIEFVTIAGYRASQNGITADATSPGVPMLTVCTLKGASDASTCAQLCGCPA
ncbi:MAG: hypothetical protein HY513_05575 [Candidatus Aenigmarchaeota archaeon]|nr:hypothetical protein [Candidatus Aenigmarchaeota archaeon]